MQGILVGMEDAVSLPYCTRACSCERCIPFLLAPKTLAEDSAGPKVPLTMRTAKP